MTNFRFVVRLGVGLFLLFGPLCFFTLADNPAYFAEPAGKALTIRLLAISLIGLLFITAVSCWELSARRKGE
jgi:hypothetical protein